ncbi:uncharacterized protein LOC130592046 [Beta vulgaris subsp. vulgaris]|uniref:uncharacterized protein LOC130592046 n=1 Tax=Beta vulgaris subsp. vulgaris TaxID=3555 RepID=UPI002546587D|nr:uncharacterized protein LOC130592046 [Beta vulgaris subsp. vulgaris]
MAAQHSSGSSNSRGSGREVQLKCYHNIPARQRTCKHGANMGKKFLGCSKWPGTSDCGFFKWEEDNEGQCHGCEFLQMKLLEQYIIIGEFELQFKTVEEKLQKLKLKKEKMEEAMHSMSDEMLKMRFESLKTAKGENYAVIALGLSWVLFVILAIWLY